MPASKTRPSVLLLTLAALLVPVASSGAHAQGDDFVTVLGTWDVDPNQYSDIWGFETDDGREFAVLCETYGLYFLETTDPYDIHLAAFVPSPTGSQRDVKYYNGYVYSVTEGGGGLQIVDARDPDNIQQVKQWTGAFHSAHNIFIDTGAGLAFPCGTDNAMPILDLSNPTKPVLVATYSRAYVHDGSAGDGLAHLALVNNGQYCVLDLTQLPNVVELGCVTTPLHHTHTLWHDHPRRLGITCDEETNGHVTVYDYTDPNNLVYLSEFDTPGTTTVHNAYLHKGLIHGAWTSDGYVVGDLSDPLHPQLVGIVDVNSQTWSVYPFTRSGNVYLSGVGSGLWVFRVEHALLDLERPHDLEDPTNPVRTVMRARFRPGAGPLGTPVMRLDSPHEGPGTVFLAPREGTHTWVGEFVAPPAPAVVRYHYELPVGNEFLSETLRQPRDPGQSYAMTVGRRTSHFLADFEDGDDAGWTHGAWFGTDDWQRGAPLGVGKDPKAAFSGTQVWGNELAGTAAPTSDRWLRSPPIPVSGHDMLRLRFRRWLSAELPADLATISVNGRAVWANPLGARIRDTEWGLEDLDITEAAEGATDVVVEFRLRTEAGSVLGGFQIDDVEVYGLDADPPAPSFGATRLVPRHAASLPSTGGGTLLAEREDVVAFDPGSQSYLRLFDGSDVGLAGAVIDAVHQDSANSLLLSFSQQVRIPGLLGGPNGDRVARCDVVRFVASQWGEDTAGTFEFHFDGSDLGLKGNDIDAITKSGNTLYFSLRKPVDLGAGIGLVDDTDVLRFTGIFGSGTTGIVRVHQDGAAVGLDQSSEGIDALTLLADGRLAFSTRGPWAIGSRSGTGSDLLTVDASGTAQVVVGGHQLFLEEAGIAAATLFGSDSP